MTDKNNVQISYTESQRLVRDYVCSRCWGQLTSTFDKSIEKNKRYKVSCPKCGDSLGFVTRDYAIQKKAESVAEKNEAKKYLGELLGMKKEPFDLEKTIKELWPG